MGTYCLINPQNPNERLVVDHPSDPATVQRWALEQYGKQMAVYSCPVSRDKIMVLCSAMQAPKQHQEQDPHGMVAAHKDDESGFTPHADDESGFEATDEEFRQQ